MCKDWYVSSFMRFMFPRGRTVACFMDLSGHLAVIKAVLARLVARSAFLCGSAELSSLDVWQPMLRSTRHTPSLPLASAERLVYDYDPIHPQFFHPSLMQIFFYTSCLHQCENDRKSNQYLSLSDQILIRSWAISNHLTEFHHHRFEILQGFHPTAIHRKWPVIRLTSPKILYS